MTLPKKERPLFITIWVILILCFGIWKFWPKEASVTLMDDPKVTFADELKPVFESAKLQNTSLTRYEVLVKLRPDFFHRFKESTLPVRIGYDLRRDQSVFDGGITVLNPPATDVVTLTITNAQRVSAKEIKLYLAH